LQLGFVIDHSRCIGCHACTVACKSENDVPLGNFRTWVKYTEQGEFPSVKRNFAVLRCNQCSDAPCVTICPTGALEKRGDGIVDVDPKACIGCKSCMHACPYDALYINESSGTAEKCHFCAHRTEVGLAPACAVVCPTEAIIPGDFDDPTSVVSRLKASGELSARKVEAGTNPNVWYREAAPAGLDPNRTNLSHGFIWSNPPTGERAEAQEWEAMEARADGSSAATARTTYDVPRKRLWGGKITGYLFAKGIAAGAVPAAALAYLIGTESIDGAGRALTGWPTLVALIGLAVTGLLLVFDLKRPERFWYILRRPNWDSWLARGTVAITLSGLLLGAGLLAGLAGFTGELSTAIYAALAALFGVATAGYTGFLFGQAKGRVLWMKRHYWAHLLAQALVAGAASVALLEPLLDWDAAALGGLAQVLDGALWIHLFFVMIEPWCAPKGREREYERASHLLTHGPYSKAHWGLGVGLGVALPLALLFAGGPLPLAALAALIGLAIEEDLFVRAGQALPIS
jgi:Fe-S-cluster-containing dehydrogenase component/formate-dependent nitrite reductase membrane component NrfD